MILRRSAFVAVIAAVLGALALSAAPQRATDPTDPVARELRDLRLTIERASAISTQATLLAMQASAAQGRIASVGVELASLRAQIATFTATTLRREQMVADFERDNPDVASNPGSAVTSPQFREYQLAKTILSSPSQPEDYFRPRENELAALQLREQAQLNELLARLQPLERSLSGQR